MDLKGRDFLTLLDFTKEEILYLLDLSKELKDKKKKGISTKEFTDKNIVLLFEKDSTRTRCAFEVAASDLGIHSTYLGPTGSQMGKKESIKDTARVLSRMYDGIEYRGFEQSIVETLAKYSDCPVWNGLTNEYHPTQILADLLTIKEHKGKLAGLKMAYFGDARYNMGNSLMIGASKVGMNFAIGAPKSLWPNEELINKCKEFANSNSSEVLITENIDEAIKDADIVVTDVWVSMGEDASVWKERINMLLPYQVNSSLMKKAKSDAIFMHCLPSFHNLETKVGKEVYDKFSLTELEVTDEVFESKQSVVFDEAENRLHTIKAVIYATLRK